VDKMARDVEEVKEMMKFGGNSGAEKEVM